MEVSSSVSVKLLLSR